MGPQSRPIRLAATTAANVFRSDPSSAATEDGFCFPALDRPNAWPTFMPLGRASLHRID